MGAINAASYHAQDFMFNRGLADRQIERVKNNTRLARGIIRTSAFIAPEGMRFQEAVVNNPATSFLWMTAWGTNMHSVGKFISTGLMKGHEVADIMQLGTPEAIGLAAIGAITFGVAARVGLNIYQNAMVRLMGSGWTSVLNGGSVFAGTDALVNGASHLKTAAEALSKVPGLVQLLINR